MVRTPAGFSVSSNRLSFKSNSSDFCQFMFGVAIKLLFSSNIKADWIF